MLIIHLFDTPYKNYKDKKYVPVYIYLEPFDFRYGLYCIMMTLL
jgi:hypothetical protein